MGLQLEPIICIVLKSVRKYGQQLNRKLTQLNDCDVISVRCIDGRNSVVELSVTTKPARYFNWYPVTIRKIYKVPRTFVQSHCSTTSANSKFLGNGLIEIASKTFGEFLIKACHKHDLCGYGC